MRSRLHVNQQCTIVASYGSCPNSFLRYLAPKRRPHSRIGAQLTNCTLALLVFFLEPLIVKFGARPGQQCDGFVVRAPFRLTGRVAPLIQRPFEWCSVVALVRRIHRGAAFDQELYCLRMTTVSGPMQPGLPIVWQPRVDANTLSQQEVHHASA